MGSRKGTLKKLRANESVLMVPKGSAPMTQDQINQFFDQERQLKKACKEAKN
jgi:hypothetical protein